MAHDEHYPLDIFKNDNRQSRTLIPRGEPHDQGRNLVRSVIDRAARHRHSLLPASTAVEIEDRASPFAVFSLHDSIHLLDFFLGLYWSSHSS